MTNYFRRKDVICLNFSYLRIIYLFERESKFQSYVIYEDRTLREGVS